MRLKRNQAMRTVVDCEGDVNVSYVSIAGAILFWGLLSLRACHHCYDCSFNRRGDSFLGATNQERPFQLQLQQFQSQGRFFFGGYVVVVLMPSSQRSFQSQGRFFFGGYIKMLKCQSVRWMFQSQGRFFFGGYRARAGDSANHDRWFQSQGRFFFGGYFTAPLNAISEVAVSIAGAILFWGLRGQLTLVI